MLLCFVFHCNAETDQTELTDFCSNAKTLQIEINKQATNIIYFYIAYTFSPWLLLCLLSSTSGVSDQLITTVNHSHKPVFLAWTGTKWTKSLALKKGCDLVHLPKDTHTQSGRSDPEKHSWAWTRTCRRAMQDQAAFIIPRVYNSLLWGTERP